MEIQEAISHARDVATSLRKHDSRNEGCACEHEQLALWLEELVGARNENAILRRMVGIAAVDTYNVTVKATGDWVAEKDVPEVLQRLAKQWRAQAVNCA